MQDHWLYCLVQSIYIPVVFTDGFYNTLKYVYTVSVTDYLELVHWSHIKSNWVKYQESLSVQSRHAPNSNPNTTGNIGRKNTTSITENSNLYILWVPHCPQHVTENQDQFSFYYNKPQTRLATLMSKHRTSRTQQIKPKTEDRRRIHGTDWLTFGHKPLIRWWADWLPYHIWYMTLHTPLFMPHLEEESPRVYRSERMSISSWPDMYTWTLVNHYPTVNNPPDTRYQLSTTMKIPYPTMSYI